VTQISIWSSLVGLVERSLEDGGTVWEYRYTGVSSPMLLPITEAWCIEYTLLFDPQKVLRYWLRKDCGQSLDLNSASANELRTLPGLRGVDVSRIIAGRPYQSRDELLTREIVPQPTWEVIKDQISANPH
jgi:Helix-hairpin-helix motif